MNEEPPIHQPTEYEIERDALRARYKPLVARLCWLRNNGGDPEAIMNIATKVNQLEMEMNELVLKNLQHDV